MSDWRIGARALADDLAAQGVLTDPAWRAAFEQVPRHVFVPAFYLDDRTLVTGDNPTEHSKEPE